MIFFFVIQGERTEGRMTFFFGHNSQENVWGNCTRLLMWYVNLLVDKDLLFLTFAFYKSDFALLSPMCRPPGYVHLQFEQTIWQVNWWQQVNFDNKKQKSASMYCRLQEQGIKIQKYLFIILASMQDWNIVNVLLTPASVRRWKHFYPRQSLWSFSEHYATCHPVTLFLCFCK